MFYWNDIFVHQFLIAVNYTSKVFIIVENDVIEMHQEFASSNFADLFRLIFNQYVCIWISTSTVHTQINVGH